MTTTYMARWPEVAHLLTVERVSSENNGIIHEEKKKAGFCYVGGISCAVDAGVTLERLSQFYSPAALLY